MGRRKKAAKKVVKKKKQGVATVFKCVFCNNDESVDCKIDLKAMLGYYIHYYHYTTTI
jgi:transcription elongation factor Elf1